MRRLSLTAAAALISVLAVNPIKAVAADPDLIKIRCTCYCEPGITRSGHYTNEHVIAGRKDDLGKVAAIYAIGEDGEIGEFIGYFDFYDTGAGIDTDGDGKGDSIKKGLSVDVFRSSLDRAKDWIRTYGDYVYIKYISAEG